MNILITGSAHGIGAATARQFAQAGHHVGIFDIDAAGAQALATQLGNNAISGVLDVCSESDCCARVNLSKSNCRVIWINYRSMSMAFYSAVTKYGLI